jgi:hypothetical protein
VGDDSAKRAIDTPVDKKTEAAVAEGLDCGGIIRAGRLREYSGSGADQEGKGCQLHCGYRDDNQPRTTA